MAIASPRRTGSRYITGVRVDHDNEAQHRLELAEKINQLVTLFNRGIVSINDGITAPDTVSGSAFIYVDTADGDLKVKFGDGIVKTISIDT
jgi:hypothetical protein